MAAKKQRKRRQSMVEGLVVVDKPVGPTSFDIVAKARRALSTRAIGHTGTLDPLASGLMVLLVGRYTRLSAHLVTDDKEYEAQVCFGTQTNTDDREGVVVATGDATGLDEESVRSAIAKMVGKAKQVPPAFSAISVGGERLYKKARRGEEVDVPPRDVEFYSLDVTNYCDDDKSAPTVDVVVRCSKGTYIRAFARDLGRDLGTCAHLSALRRTKNGDYDVTDAVTLDELQEQGAEAVQKGASAVRGIAQLVVSLEQTKELEQGRGLPVDDVNGAAELEDEAIVLVHCDDAPVAICARRGDVLAVSRGFGPAPSALGGDVSDSDSDKDQN